MQIEIRQYEQRDAAQAAEIWNEVVEDGKAFPQMEKLDEVTGHAFFTEQTYTGVAYAAVISATQAMQLKSLCADSISVKNSLYTA